MRSDSAARPDGRYRTTTILPVSTAFRALSSTAVDDPNDHNSPRKDGAAVYPQCYDGQERLPGGRCVFSRLKAKNEDSVYLAVVFGTEITAGELQAGMQVITAQKTATAK